jgi:hypothetical protein
MPTQAETDKATADKAAAEQAKADDAAAKAEAKAAKAKLVTVRVNDEIAAYGGSFADNEQPTNAQMTIGKDPIEVVRTELVNQKLKTEELIKIEAD